jgi:hypothetical protein
MALKSNLNLMGSLPSKNVKMARKLSKEFPRRPAARSKAASRNCTKSSIGTISPSGRSSMTSIRRRAALLSANSHSSSRRSATTTSISPTKKSEVGLISLTRMAPILLNLQNSISITQRSMEFLRVAIRSMSR